MKRLKIDLIKPGDIILTASATKIGKVIRISTNGLVSHAMICVQHGSIIDSTSAGVQARNLQREVFGSDEEVFAFRLRDPLSKADLARVIDFARTEIGTRYSTAEAIRSFAGGPKPRTAQQFCSRLVARAYASIGIHLAGDQDYCTPEDLRRSPLLVELTDVIESLPEEDLAVWSHEPSPLRIQQEAQNGVLSIARKLDPTIENFTDLDRFLQHHPESDTKIACAYREEGYLDLWRTDFEDNPWRYDCDALEAFSTRVGIEKARDYCVATIREAQSGGFRYAANLIHYQTSMATMPRETTAQLIVLYDRLVRNDALRRDAALAWLKQHFPNDAASELERIEPHSDRWFDMVDRVEPRLCAIARLNVTQAGSVEVCSTCGDPASDYRLVNGADAMPGVPSLRLCTDCVDIRRKFGEVLEPFI